MNRGTQWTVFSNERKEGFDFTPHGYLTRTEAETTAQRLANIHPCFEFHVARMWTSFVQRTLPPLTVITYNPN